jgi:threonine aldolase
MTRPQMVYISQPTELGTLYSRSELVDLSQFCKEHNLYLYMDGARLGSALVAAESDVSLGDLTQLIDIFYIGGTKNGALFGEAIVIINDNLKKDFLFYLKQRGALLAKGRVLGIQFMELFSNNLYFDLARHANNMAKKLTNAFRNFGYQFLTESTTNQLFPILPNHVIKKLSEHYDFYVWKKLENDCAAIRLVTSWNTPEPMIDEFVANLEKIN